jgi:hypothetical protein
MTDNIIPFTDPNSDPVQDKLAQAHDDEAARLGVKFTNWGWVTVETGICSKTTKGILESSIDPNSLLVSHNWITYEEKARRDEQQIREMLEGVGRSVRDHVVRHLRPLREVYGDLAEFAPVWEAIDKLGDKAGTV